MTWIVPPTRVAVERRRSSASRRRSPGRRRRRRRGSAIGSTLAARRVAEPRLLGAHAAHAPPGRRPRGGSGSRPGGCASSRPSRRAVQSPVAPRWYLTSPLAEHAARVDVLEAGEDLERRPADHLGHHVQPAAVAHGEHRLLGAVRGGGVEHLGEERDEGGHAFEREALGADVARVERRSKSSARSSCSSMRRASTGGAGDLHALGDPGAPLRVGDVHELDGDRAAVERRAARGLVAAQRELRVRRGLRRPSGSRSASR